MKRREGIEGESVFRFKQAPSDERALECDNTYGVNETLPTQNFASMGNLGATAADAFNAAFRRCRKRVARPNHNQRSIATQRFNVDAACSVSRIWGFGAVIRDDADVV